MIIKTRTSKGMRMRKWNFFQDSCYTWYIMYTLRASKEQVESYDIYILFSKNKNHSNDDGRTAVGRNTRMPVYVRNIISSWAEPLPAYIKAQVL